MTLEILVYATDPAQARDEVAAAGGRVSHVLTDHLWVVELPDGVSVLSLSGLSPARPERLEGTERVVAEAWITRVGAESTPEARAAQVEERPSTGWDTPGFLPPDGPPDEEDSHAAAEEQRSTGTPTSLTLTGSVAVGVVMVSGPAEAWLPIQGALKYVSAAADGAVWGVNAADNIYRWNGSGWTQVPGALKQISVGSTGLVWGVNAADKIYRWNGSSWTQVSGALKHVSVAADGAVWGVNAADKIYRWNGSSWTQVPGALKQLSVGSASAIWGVNAADNIYRWNGSSWTQVPGALKHVSVAADGAVWGVNAADNIYRRTGSSWTQVPGALKQVSVSNASNVWGVNSADTIYLRGPGTGLQLTAAEKAHLTSEVIESLAWLASADPEANVSFVYDWRDVAVDAGAGVGNSYEEREAPWRDAALKKMGFAGSRAGSRAYVEALRTSKHTDWAYVAYLTRYPLHWFAYAGQERLVMHYDNDGWGPAIFNQVFAHETCHIFGAADEYGSCSCAGSGVSNAPNLNCVNCTTTPVPCLMNQNTLSLCPWSRAQIGWSLWKQIAGALKHVSVAADGTVWGVNAADNIYRWNGSSWTQVSGALKQISVGSATLIWGVNAADKIYRWNGSSWTQIPGALKHVSVAADGTVWGVNAADNIYRWNGNAWDRVPGALKQVDAGSSVLVWGVNTNDNIYRLR
jgi:hypothetical protein